MRDQGTGEEDSGLQEVLLDPMALSAQGVELLAKAAGRGGIHGAMDTKCPSTNLGLTFGKQ